WEQPIPKHIGDDFPVPEQELQQARDTIATFEKLASGVSVEAPWLTPGAQELDSQTLDSWIAANAQGDFARHLMTSRALAAGGGAYEPAAVSMLHHLYADVVSPQQEAPETDLFYGAAGGIALALSTELHDHIRLAEPVHAIEHHDSGVMVHTSSSTHTAGQVIVAMPPALTQRIAFDPPLPAQRAQLVQQVPMGQLIKVHAIYETAWWREAGLSGIATGDLPTLMFVADSSDPTGSPGILTSFISGERCIELGQQSLEERQHAVTADLTQYFGPRASRPVEYIEANWPADPWTGGAFTSYFPPGVWTSLGPALRASIGRIHWAGTEVATKWAGFFDGAVQAGETAANNAAHQHTGS
ncbi:MAG: FAD-dependent oxidoreductase, partial [Actinobacteria bacterium]|nr:FAD-dependent oxidoreductase [Actinomycetota bacterium]